MERDGRVASPSYIKEYPLVVELRSPRDSVVIRVPVDIRKWLPGDAVFDGTLFLPTTLPAGKYDVRVAMIDPQTGAASVLSVNAVPLHLDDEQSPLADVVALPRRAREDSPRRRQDR